MGPSRRSRAIRHSGTGVVLSRHTQIRRAGHDREDLQPHSYSQLRLGGHMVHQPPLHVDDSISSANLPSADANALLSPQNSTSPGGGHTGQQLPQIDFESTQKSPQPSNMLLCPDHDTPLTQTSLSNLKNAHKLSSPCPSGRHLGRPYNAG